MLKNALPLLLASTAGCYVYGYDTVPGPAPAPPPPVVVNYLPEVYAGDAYVTPDDITYDDLWVFQAWVTDPDGDFDVDEVWAYVYDPYWSDVEPVDAFPLEPTAFAGEWASTWYGSDTYLDPFYGFYEVDLIAYDDPFDDSSFGALTVFPQTYY